jgi:putative FmdB family regulatory protein
MPIYEYYCPECHAVYNFFARSAGTSASPSCPDCGRKALERQISSFSFTGQYKQTGEDTELPIDDSRMMAAMESLAQEAGGLDEQDPKKAADLIRKFTKMTGLELNGTMDEALSRLESGETPESIESELGSQLDAEDPFLSKSRSGSLSAALRKHLPPRRDETLYDL